jgi:hypothetical protein
MATPLIDVQWEAPAECPDANSVKARAERLLGRRLTDLQNRDIRARGVVRRNEAGNWELQAMLAVGEQVENETLVAKRCASLGDAMALKLALAIDPLAVVDAVQEPPESQPKVTPPRARDQVPRHTDTGKVATRPRLGLRLVGAVGLGPLPGVTPGAGLFLSLQLPVFRLELGGQAHWSGVARYDSPAPPNVGADLNLFFGAARGCVTPGSGRWIFPICGGLELGLMRGVGFGVPATKTTSGVWGGVAIGPAVQLRLFSHLSLWVEADASLTLLKPEFHVRNLPTLYTPPDGSSRVAAGFEMNF